MPAYAYTGERCPALVPVCVFEGWTDRKKYGLLWKEQLYREPTWKQAGWRLGWVAAFMTGAPSRLAKKSGKPA